MPGPSGRSTTVTRSTPPPACLTRLEASSLATIETWPVAVSLKPSPRLTVAARRCASPTPLASSTRRLNRSFIASA